MTASSRASRCPRSASGFIPSHAKHWRARRQAPRRGSVGLSRAARSAGYSPATAPIASAAPAPPTTASAGTATAQPWLVVDHQDPHARRSSPPKMRASDEPERGGGGERGCPEQPPGRTAGRGCLGGGGRGGDEDLRR